MKTWRPAAEQMAGPGDPGKAGDPRYEVGATHASPLLVSGNSQVHCTFVVHCTWGTTQWKPAVENVAGLGYPAMPGRRK